MFNIERQKEILDILIQSKSATVQKLSKLLYASPPTIRRDLTALEAQGKVLRTHGGVVLRQAAESEIPLMYREEQSSHAKQIIAQKAAEYIKNGDVIFLDASSTVAHLVPHLKKFKNIVVVTNSPKTSLKLGEENIRNFCTGGLLLAHSVAYVGNEAESFIANINADLMFFSSRGYTEDGFATDSSVEEAAVRKAMLKNASRAYYLADSSKKNQKYMYNICQLKNVTKCISEEDD